MFRFGVVKKQTTKQIVVEVDDNVYALATILPELQNNSLDELFADWDEIVEKIETAIGSKKLTNPLKIEDYEFESPVSKPPKVICIGINYHDHIEEMGVNAPEYPYAFLRPPKCVTGHDQDIKLPKWPEMVDWEAELGVVIGVEAKNLTKENALDAVAGYAVINDVSARDWIESRPFIGVDWVMQKAWDDFNPMGPWLVPAKYIEDPQALDMELTVNGVMKQQQTTGKMVFSVVDILVHLSEIMTLEPGDIIATGTPSGVGFGRRPMEFLKPGDVVSISISKLGTLTNKFV